MHQVRKAVFPVANGMVKIEIYVTDSGMICKVRGIYCDNNGKQITYTGWTVEPVKTKIIQMLANLGIDPGEVREEIINDESSIFK